MPHQSDQPTWAQLRSAVRAVRRAEFGSEALNAVRPRGVLGIVRARGPLSVRLAVAAREDRLVWQDSDGFALLEMPAAVQPATRDSGVRAWALRRLDRNWEQLVLAAPSFVLLGSAVGAAAIGWVLAAQLLVLAAVGYLALLLTAGVVYATVWFARTFGGRIEPGTNLAEEARAGTTWQLALCHQTDLRRAAELLRRSTNRVDELVRASVAAAAAERGARVEGVAVIETLTCDYRAATTTAMRRVVVSHARSGSHRVGDEVVLLVSGEKTVATQARAVASGGFLFWYLAGMTVAMVVSAVFVADAERAACVDDCAGRPATYEQAVRYLAQRLFWRNEPDLTPATGGGYLIGWLTSVMSLVLIFVASVSVRQYRRVVAIARAQRDAIAWSASTVLILVVTKAEFDAVLRAVRRVTSKDPVRQPKGRHGVFDLGRISDTDVFVARSEPGSLTPGGALETTASVLPDLRPDYVVMVGICFGLKTQPFGDILVSRQLEMVGNQKVVDAQDEGEPSVEIIRGDRVSASPELLERFRAAELDWTGAAVHFGLILSSDTLVDSAGYRAQLQKIAPDGIGGEMEGAGVYVAAARERTDWILVKAVADHGADKSDDAHELAAGNAADFVVHALTSSLLDRPARR